MEARSDYCIIGEFQNVVEYVGGSFRFAGIFFFQQGEHGSKKKGFSPRFEKEGKEKRQIRIGGKRERKEGNETVFRWRFIEKNGEEEEALKIKGGKKR